MLMLFRGEKRTESKYKLLAQSKIESKIGNFKNIKKYLNDSLITTDMYLNVNNKTKKIISKVKIRKCFSCVTFLSHPRFPSK